MTSSANRQYEEDYRTIRPRWTTVAGFKGLEAKAVILLMPMHAADKDRMDEFRAELYVGSSRARHRLSIVFAPVNYGKIAADFWRCYEDYRSRNSPYESILQHDPLMHYQLFREIEVDEGVYVSIGIGLNCVRIFVRGEIGGSGNAGHSEVEILLSSEQERLERRLGAGLGCWPYLFLNQYRADLQSSVGLFAAVEWLSDRASCYVKTLMEVLGVQDRGPWTDEMRGRHMGLNENPRQNQENAVRVVARREMVGALWLSGGLHSAKKRYEGAVSDELGPMMDENQGADIRSICDEEFGEVVMKRERIAAERASWRCADEARVIIDQVGKEREGIRQESLKKCSDTLCKEVWDELDRKRRQEYARIARVQMRKGTFTLYPEGEDRLVIGNLRDLLESRLINRMRKFGGVSYTEIGNMLVQFRNLAIGK